MPREWQECDSPDRDPDYVMPIDVPPEEGEHLLVWYDEERTVTEVSGAHQNMGASWTPGRVPLEELVSEIEKELNNGDDRD